MEKILALLADIKGFFTGANEKLDKITTAEERVKSLEADLATAKQSISSLGSEVEQEKKSHGETKDLLQKAQEEVNAKGTEIASLQKQIETEKKRANETIASQALPADQLPTATVSSTPQGNPTAPGLDPKLKGNSRLMAHFSKQQK